MHASPVDLRTRPKVFGIALFHASPHRWHTIYTIQSDLHSTLHWLYQMYRTEVSNWFHAATNPPPPNGPLIKSNTTPERAWVSYAGLLRVCFFHAEGVSCTTMSRYFESGTMTSSYFLVRNRRSLTSSCSSPSAVFT